MEHRASTKAPFGSKYTDKELEISDYNNEAHLLNDKYVIKRLNQYYPLINFGIDGRKFYNCPTYRLNKIYNNPIDFKTPVKSGIGYYFFDEPFPITYKTKTVKNWWEEYFKKIHNKDIKITVIKCKIWEYEITKGCGYKTKIIANKFKILEEI